MAYLPYNYTGITSTVTSSTSYSSPAVGEVRYDAVKDVMHTWDGKQWVVLYGHKETVRETVQESVDRIVLQIDEDYPNNTTILDALKEWEAASEKFQVILALTEKNK